MENIDKEDKNTHLNKAKIHSKTPTNPKYNNSKIKHPTIKLFKKNKQYWELIKHKAMQELKQRNEIGSSYKKLSHSMNGKKNKK